MTKGVARKGFDLDLADGIIAENKLLDILKSTNAKIEVKRDFQYKTTGNLFIETSYRNKPSGISTTEADWWAVEFEDNRFVLVTTDFVKRLVRFGQKQNMEICGGDDNRSGGVIVPMKWFLYPSHKLEVDSINEGGKKAQGL